MVRDGGDTCIGRMGPAVLPASSFGFGPVFFLPKWALDSCPLVGIETKILTQKCQIPTSHAAG